MNRNEKSALPVKQTKSGPLQIYLARTQGFCAGVSYAIEIVERVIDHCGLPVYVYHEIVHNSFVVNQFRARGVIFVEDLSTVPPYAHLIFSAHGVPPTIILEAQRKNIHIFDATCPLVKKVHLEAIRYSQKGYVTVLIGHKGHQEMIGTAGYIKPDLLQIVEKAEDVDNLMLSGENPIAYLTQTTLSLDETSQIIQRLKSRFPKVIEPNKDDICYATQNRQNAVKEITKFCDAIIICGSANSSNSNRLRETGEAGGVPSCIVDSATDFDFSFLTGKTKVGISSGASVPKSIVNDLIHRIVEQYPSSTIHTFPNLEKNIVFPLPEINKSSKPLNS